MRRRELVAGLIFWLSPLFIEAYFFAAAAAMLIAGVYLAAISLRRKGVDADG